MLLNLLKPGTEQQAEWETSLVGNDVVADEARLSKKLGFKLVF